MQSGSGAFNLSRYINHAYSTIIKLMALTSETEDRTKFDIHKLFHTVPVQRAYEHLKGLGWLPNTILNYLKLHKKLIKAIQSQYQTPLTSDEFRANVANIVPLIDTLERQARVAQRKRNEKIEPIIGKSKLLTTDEVNHVHELIKAEAQRIPFAHARIEKGATSRTYHRTVTMYFCSLIALKLEHRPSVFTYMELSAIDNCREIQHSDATMYGIFTDKHKTGSHYVGFITLTSEEYADLRSYIAFVRPAPMPGYEQYLFLNSTGRSYANPSCDLGKTQILLGMATQITSTQVRQLVE